MIVVDTNILMFIASPAPSATLLERVRFRDAVWIAPKVWRSEMRNALAGYIRATGMSAERATALVQEAEDLLTIEVESTTELIFQLVETSKCSAYDLEFVALATDRNLQFVTFDKQVLREFPEIAVHPADFVA